jgi:hypothetical protein
VALALLGAAGCIDWFRPARPEPPVTTGPAVDVSIDFGDPEAVLATVSAAVAARGGGNGAFAYRSAFADSATDGIKYVCEFATEVVIERTNAGRTIPVWSRERESQFYTYLVGLNSGDYVLQWDRYDGAPIDDVSGADEQTLYRQYDVLAISEDGGTQTQVAHGRADLVFRRVRQNEWAIVRWKDLVDPVVGPDPEDPGLRSFSRLRIDSTGDL